MSFIGDLASAGVQAKSAEYQQDLAMRMGPLNQQLYGLAGQQALQSGDAAASAAQVKGSQVVGQQRAGYAASGVDLSSGTPMETMADSRVMSEVDAATVRANAAREAWGYRVKGLQTRQQSVLDVAKAQGDMFGSIIGGGGKAMGDVTKLGGI